MTAFYVQILLDTDESYVPLDKFIDNGDYLYDGSAQPGQFGDNEYVPFFQP